MMKELVGIIVLVSIPVALFAAWVTHCVWWIKLMMAEQLDTIGEAVLTILGTLCPPIGAIHGFVIWF